MKKAVLMTAFFFCVFPQSQLMVLMVAARQSGSRCRREPFSATRYCPNASYCGTSATFSRSTNAASSFPQAQWNPGTEQAARVALTEIPDSKKMNSGLALCLIDRRHRLDLDQQFRFDELIDANHGRRRRGFL